MESQDHLGLEQLASTTVFAAMRIIHKHFMPCAIRLFRCQPDWSQMCVLTEEFPACCDNPYVL